MIEVLNSLYTIFPNLPDFIGLIGVVSLILGIANTFFGYKIFKILLAIIGFIIGASVGLIIFVAAGNNSTGSDIVIAYMVIGGFIGSAVSELFYTIGVFITVSAMGAIIVFIMTQDSQNSLIAGVICGIVSIFIQKYIIIISTAISGGMLISTGIWFMSLSHGTNSNPLGIGWVLGVIGIFFQLWLEKRSPAEDMGLKSKFEFIEDIRLKLSGLDIDDVKSFAIKFILAIPIIIGVMVGNFFDSFFLGLGLITILYIIVMILFIKFTKSGLLSEKAVHKYAWEEWASKILLNNLFMVIAFIFPGIFIGTLVGTFTNDIVGWIIGILGAVGTFLFVGKAASAFIDKNNTSVTTPDNPKIIETPETKNDITDDKTKAVSPDSSNTATKPAIMFCRNCGNKLSEEAKFCKQCGNKVR